MDITLEDLATRPAPPSCPLITLSFRRPRVQIAVLLAAVCVFPLAGLQIGGAAAQQRPQDVVLVPHRATYDMKLSVARANSGIADVNGRMVLETVDSCDGWEVKQRIKLKFLRNDGEEFDTDSTFTSYESKDGLGLRFSVRNIQDNEVEEELRGQADLEGQGGKGRASFTLPEIRSFELPAGTLFPTTHLARIIRHARDGDKSATYYVFDGARLDGAFQVNAVIGKAPRSSSTPIRGDVALLRNQPSWSVRLAFFAAGDQGANPEYELALDLLANGIARSMVLDYGDFAVDARLVQLQALPRPRC
ncbi:MAG: cell envelope integrity EipB family protein [Alphaproteobacteria bacterium]|nr:cell envelope integrity EipB family protein [Alphaproteobacteria bacterium]MBV8407845.1 cell envelope integrity EipB family protein [Alphaproteobacteria bacterium]